MKCQSVASQDASGRRGEDFLNQSVARVLGRVEGEVVIEIEIESELRVADNHTAEPLRHDVTFFSSHVVFDLTLTKGVFSIPMCTRPSPPPMKLPYP